MTDQPHAALTKQLGPRAAIAGGWTWTWQRCGRNEYRKRLVHMTNPDDLVPRSPSPTSVPSLRITGVNGG